MRNRCFRSLAFAVCVLCCIGLLMGTAPATASTGPWQQTAMFTASNQVSYQYLGRSAAVSADGNVVAFGATMPDSGAGAIYVYTRASGSAWSPRTQTAILTPNDGATGDQLGKSLAMSADGSVIVAGAPAHATGTTSGAVYVFVRNGATWTSGTQTAQLVAFGNNGDLVRGMGESVAISRDGTQIVAGAPNAILSNTLQMNDAGLAYVFTKPTGGWADSGMPNAILRLSPTLAAQNDLFGASVATNADGSVVVVGASGRTADNGGSYRGVGYVFDLSGGASGEMTPVATLRANTTTDSNDFGAAAAMDASGNTVLIGAPGTTSVSGDPTTTGAAFVFTKPAAGWNGMQFATARLKASDGIDNDHFGNAVALSVDGTIAAIGTPGYDDAIAVPDDGVAHIFFRASGGWVNATEDDIVPAESSVVGGEAAGTGIGLSANGEVLAVGAPMQNYGSYPNTEPHPRFAGAGYALQFGADVRGPTQLNEYINAPLVYTYTVRGIPAPAPPVLTGALPNGVTFDAATGRLSGTPSQGGVFTFTLTASNFIGYTATAQLVTTMNMISEVVILGSNPPVGVIGRTFAHTFTSNVSNPAWSLQSGTLPGGVGFANGKFSGTPTASGTFNAAIRADAGPLSNTRPVSIRVYDVLTITTPAIGNGYANVPYSAALATNLLEPAAWSLVSGALPPGVGLNPDTGALSGLPTQGGTFAFTVRVAQATQTATRAYAVTMAPPLVIADASLPDALVHTPYQVVFAANATPASWNVVAGALPEGLSLNAGTGTLAGMPTKTGNYAFTVKATAGPQTAVRTFSLTVTPRRVFAPLVSR